MLLEEAFVPISQYKQSTDGSVAKTYNIEAGRWESVHS